MELKLPKNQDLKLFPFQEEVIKQMLSSPSKYHYNACEMGLGKTPQSLVYAMTLQAQHIVVICPAHLRLNWMKETLTWTDMKEHEIATILSGQELSINDHTKMIIVSYDLVATNENVFKAIYNFDADIIIADEFHYCRNLTAKRTQAILSLWEEVEYFLALSGSPMLRCATDLYPMLSRVIGYLDNVDKQFKYLCSEFKLFATYFSYAFYNPNSRKQEYRGAKNVEELRHHLYNNDFFHRKTKKEVLTDLPDKIYSTFPINLDIEEEVESKEIAEFLKHYKLNQSKTNVSKAIVTLRRKLGEAKVAHKETKDFIESFLEQEIPIVIFAYHRNVIDSLKKTFIKYNPVVVDGRVTVIEKQKAVNDFQEGVTNIFIGQIIAAGVGINLTRASNAIFLEYDWLPGNNEQALDRLHRIGQKNTVTAHYIISNNEFDRQIVATIINKQRVINKVI